MINILFILLFSMLFSSNAISILKEDRNVLRAGISSFISVSTILDEEEMLSKLLIGDILVKGYRAVNLSYIFKKHCLLSGFIGIDTKSKGISFSYYELFNNIFVNANFGLVTFPGATEYFNNGFYNTAGIGLGLSKSLTDNLDLLSRYSYGGIINSGYAFLSGSIGTYLHIKFPPKKDVNLHIGVSQNLRSEKFNPGFNVGISYDFDI